MPRLRTLLLLLGDILVLSSSYIAAAAIILGSQLAPDLELALYFQEERGFFKIGVLVVTLLLGFYFLNLYENVRVRSRRRLAEDLMLIFGVSFLLQALVSYVSRPIMMSRSIMILGSSFAFVFLILWRSTFSYFVVRILGRQKVLFIGDNALSRTLAHHIVEHPEKGFEVLACLDEKGPDGEPFPGGPTLLIEEDLAAEVKRLKPDRISVAGEYPRESPVSASLLWCSMQRLKVESAGELHEHLFQRVALETVTTEQLIFSPAFRAPILTEVIQSIYGPIFSLLGIALTWPLMLLTAIAVKLDSPGPALLRQERVGLNGRHFFILKFRSMFVDADKRFGRTRADKEDPRITRVGRFIRVTRLDELPQFVNVLRGDMTFVGPRPEMPVYVRELTAAIPLYPQRLRVKPGLTGWAQLHHVPELSAKETALKLSYDLYYIKNMSFLLDVMIVFHTLKAVLFRTGAR
jgi:exopolysaccharide biosynthesis polyprenyl glycosylphosphotransferase